VRECADDISVVEVLLGCGGSVYASGFRFCRFVSHLLAVCDQFLLTQTLLTVYRMSS
jgi:hypothetical protein